MKTSNAVIFAALILLPGSCIFREYGLNSGPSRAECFYRDPHGHGKDSISRPLQSDTAIYFCAVSFSSGYEWQRDTAYGSEPYELLFYRDSKPVLSISSRNSGCISPDHDTHHIIGGHLYTEHSGPASTSIGRDGEEILNFTGREFLKGLLPDGEDIYTLGQRRDGNGFTFRKNGEVVLAKSGCVLFGGMDNPSYGETGALYLDRGDITFFYWTGKGSLRRYFRVRNGKEEEITQFSGVEYSDMKPYNGMPLAAGYDMDGYSPVSCNLWILPPEIITAGLMRKGNSTFSGIFRRSSGELLEICDTEAAIYCSDKAWYAIEGPDNDGNIRMNGYKGERHVEEDCHFLSPGCAVLCGDKFIYGLSSRKKNGYPKIWTGKEFENVEINGYISRVAAVINPAS